MSEFNIYDSIYNWHNTGVVISEKNRSKADNLVRGMLYSAVKKYLNESIVIEEPDHLYWDKVWDKYVEPSDIIESAAFEMWEENWYPDKSQKLESLNEGSEIEDFLEDLKPMCDYHILSIKRKLF